MIVADKEKQVYKEFPSLLTQRENKMRTWFTNAKPYLLLLAVQFGSAGMFIFAMDAMRKGMSHYVFTVYRNLIAFLTLSPFAFLLERSLPLIGTIISLHLLIYQLNRNNVQLCSNILSCLCRKVRPKMTVGVFSEIMALAFFE